jgi:DNA repair photolyase
MKPDSRQLQSPLTPEFTAAQKGRGARANPTGRFERFAVEPDLEAQSAAAAATAVLLGGDLGDEGNFEAEGRLEHGLGAPRRTQFLPDPSRTALSFNQSPDIPFDASLNPYRGCEHGCAYCYARPTHEYLGYSAGLDFETKILVKQRAPELLRRELAAPRWVPQVVALSGVTDAYQPIERKLELTRRCIAVFVEFRNPITIITKNALVTRDIDLIRELADHRAASVMLSIGSLDPEIQRTLEPRASSIPERLRAIEALARAGIPTGVMLGPVIPGLTDHEMPAILEAAKSAGATHASYIVLRLPFGLKALFQDWLETHQPLRRDKVIHRLESLRAGQLNDPRFGSRMRGEGHFADQIGGTFRIWARKLGLDRPRPALSTESWGRPAGPQLELAL